MPLCAHCGQEFNRTRDTKRFCRATCRSLFRYHKKGKVKDEKVIVQDISVQKENPVVSVQEKPKQAKVSVTDSKWDRMMKRYD